MFIVAQAACSSSDDNSSGNRATLNGDHVWKDQTEALKQAQEVSALANEAAEQQRKAMEELNQP